PSSAPLAAAPAYQVLVLGVMAVLALWCWLRPLRSPRDVATRALLLCLALLVLTTPSYPWYRLLLLAFVPFASGPPVLAASLAVAVAPFLYLHWSLPGLPTWPDDLVYLGSAAALAGAGLWVGVRRLRAGGGK
ncbi:MAG: hypothetical protein HYU88_12660, partial [Chloroflexi bacterium]|nr:hypothetical protein [Chloroflexota bacterium]